jgi:hypothetical protein
MGQIAQCVTMPMKRPVPVPAPAERLSEVARDGPDAQQIEEAAADRREVPL